MARPQSEALRGALAVFVLVVAATLQGCGDHGVTTTTTTTTTTGAAATGDCPHGAQSTLQSIAQKWANQQKYSVAVGFAGRLANGTRCSMGHVAHPPGKLPSPAGDSLGSQPVDGAFLFGSFTKLWTASAVMKLYEEGKLDIDAPAYPYMEKAYSEKGATNSNSSLVSRFGETIRRVTARQLLSMRGSIGDYDELSYQEQHPDEDIGPARSAELFGQSTAASPGSCGVYSSMSYVLLGLLLVGQSDANSWDGYDQNVWRKSFPNVRFGIHGPCKDYTDVRGHCQLCEKAGRDISDMSCSGGFTCGNLIAHPQDAARFMRSLFKGELLNASTVQQMTKYTPLGAPGASPGTSCSSWCDGCLYGLGVQSPANGLPPSASFPGHSGDTYGFMSTNAYDQEKDASIVAATANDVYGAGSIWGDIHAQLVEPAARVFA